MKKDFFDVGTCNDFYMKTRNNIQYSKFYVTGKFYVFFILFNFVFCFLIICCAF